MNQFGNHLQWQVVQNHYANDLDLFDRHQTRLHLFSQVVIANQLPAYSAGNFQPQPNRRKTQAEIPAHRTQDACAPQKENQCQES
ncbi:MAG: hypothetical protein DMF74_04160 [Acidobacteria bacterium]|nr:MAG: hypothetical protein DMF74_04160 [Acidobacteriota bacterium]